IADEVNRVLVQKRLEQLRSSNDEKLFNDVAILGNLKQLVTETNLTHEMIQDIRKQLAGMGYEGKPQDPAKPSNGSTTPPYPPPAHLLAPKPAPAATAPLHMDVDAAPAPAAVPKTATKKKDPAELLQTLMANTDLMNALNKVMPGKALEEIALTHHSVI
ncbi:hypothetical protein FBU59_007077, partial [Linderina macrospora]